MLTLQRAFQLYWKQLRAVNLILSYFAFGTVQLPLAQQVLHFCGQSSYSPSGLSLSKSELPRGTEIGSVATKQVFCELYIKT